MNRRKLPYFPLYVQDFLTDEKLSQCSAESTGVYIRLLCLLHKSDPYGTIELTDKDKKNPDPVFNFSKKIGRNMPYDFNVVLEAIKELLENKVISIDGNFLFQKRMLLDAELSEKRAEAGSKGFKLGRGKSLSEKQKLENLDTKNDFAIANPIAKPIAGTMDFAITKSIANAEYEIEIENENEFENEIDKKEKKITEYNQLVKRNQNAIRGDSGASMSNVVDISENYFEANGEAPNALKNDFSFDGTISAEKTEQVDKIINELTFVSSGKAYEWKREKSKFLEDEVFKYKICSLKNLEKLEIENWMTEFITDIEVKGDYKTKRELQIHFTNIINKKTKSDGTTKKPFAKPTFRDLLKESGTRLGEIGKLKGKDFDQLFR